MGLRALLAVVEATYARDASVREQAERFYKDLYDYLNVEKDVLERRLTPGKNGVFSVMARAFTDVGPANLIVVFATSVGGRKGGTGKLGHMDAMVINALLAPGDLAHLQSRVQKNVVVHEMVHILDPGRRKGQMSAKAVERGDVAGYYNEPGEWNAYWQEGASQLERMLRTLTNNAGLDPDSRSKALDFMFGDGSLRSLQGKVERFWDVDFLDAMDAKVRRKFDKRLAALWAALREQGMLRGAP
jgi:hypothetical protein